jgi:hypothetical protein
MTVHCCKQHRHKPTATERVFPHLINNDHPSSLTISPSSLHLLSHQQMDFLSRLPVELAVQILSLAPRQTQFTLRLVNRQLEQVVTAMAFLSIRTCFRPESFRHLELISQSPHLARHVKSFEYVFVGVYSTRKPSISRTPASIVSVC